MYLNFQFVVSVDSVQISTLPSADFSILPLLGPSMQTKKNSLRVGT
jgi:hypothetical protein